MKKGKWNYSEGIEYRVILVKIHAVKEKPMYWQNAFEGQERQIVEVEYFHPDGSKGLFWLDNQDGTGLAKIEKGGGPDSYSAHLEENTFDFIRELEESEWQYFDVLIYNLNRAQVDEYQKTNFPKDYEEMQSFKRSFMKIKNPFSSK